MPIGGLLQGTGPVEAEVDMVGMGVNTVIRDPARAGIIERPESVIPDDVHNAQAADHGVGVAVLIFSKKPVEDGFDVLDITGVVHRYFPIPGAPLMVFADGAIARRANTVIGSLRKGLQDELLVSNDTGFVSIIAGRLRLIPGNTIDLRAKIIRAQQSSR